MFQYDVKSTAIAAAQTDAPVFAGAARIKGILIGVPAAGGTLTLKNGSAGTTAFTFVTPAIGQSLNVSIPGDGIRCENGIYATTTAGMTATVFYG
jgi:hypothetical protein